MGRQSEGKGGVDLCVAIAINVVEQAHGVAVLREEFLAKVEKQWAERFAAQEAREEAHCPFGGEGRGRLAFGADHAARPFGHEVGNEAIVELWPQLRRLARIDEYERISRK